MALPTDPQILFGVGLLLVSALVGLVSLRYGWRLSHLVRAPTVTSLTRTDPGEVVRIEGTVVADGDRTITAPISGRDCVVVEASVEERRLSPYGLPWFVTLWEDQRAVGFETRTGEATVPVENPVHSVALTPDDVTTVGFEDEPPQRIGEFEAATGAVPSSTVWRDPPGFLAPLWRALSFGSRRYSESALREGEETMVVGWARADGGVTAMILSDRPPRKTMVRMGRTAAAGVAISVGGLALGAVLILL